MKIHTKKKIYRAFIRSQIKAGLIGNVYGQWVSNTGKNGMERDIKAGYRV